MPAYGTNNKQSTTSNERATSNVSITCHSCGSERTHVILDLGAMPLANSFLKSKSDFPNEKKYPLQVHVCSSCWLVQVPEVIKPEAIFSCYSYFSSYSDTWLSHCLEYAREHTELLNLTPDKTVVEIASNDGIMLKQFADKNIKILGIEPAVNIAEYANKSGIKTISDFFGARLARELKLQGYSADLMIANNVLAHVPDINDFIAGFRILLKPDGIITFEFPHLLNLLQYRQFDTIYHEHYSYLSLTALLPLFSKHGLYVFAVRKLPTHGGSLRLYVCHEEFRIWSLEFSKNQKSQIIDEEHQAKFQQIETYGKLAGAAENIRHDLRNLLVNLKADRNKIAAYGAPAKGNTLLNYCGIDASLIAYTVDRNPEKQGTYLPGSHIPVYAPEHLLHDKPDYILILPWNIADEIMEQLNMVKDYGGKFITAIPEVRII